jgi:hypothetical protein
VKADDGYRFRAHTAAAARAKPPSAMKRAACGGLHGRSRRPETKLDERGACGDRRTANEVVAPSRSTSTLPMGAGGSARGETQNASSGCAAVSASNLTAANA